MAVFGYDFFVLYYDIDFQFFLPLTFHSSFSHSRIFPCFRHVCLLSCPQDCSVLLVLKSPTSINITFCFSCLNIGESWFSINSYYCCQCNYEVGVFEWGTAENYGREITSENSGKFMAFMIQPPTLSPVILAFFFAFFNHIFWTSVTAEWLEKTANVVSWIHDGH